jgi:cysteine-rich repeat protein
MPDEECDDGNNINNDGCSAVCKVENDFNCTLSSNPPLNSSICYYIGNLNISVISITKGSNDSEINV